jgi:prepilin-type N-terminal cleavage/methylation domain-containing protein
MKIYGNKNGFTIIEVIAILVIIGIVSVVAVLRISFSNENNIIAAKDTLTSHIRLAQARAMSTAVDTTISVWGVRFISTTQYQLFYCDTASGCNPSLAINQTALPGGIVVMDLAGKGVQITNGAGILAFNRFGTPYTDATLTTKLAAALVLNLLDSSGRTKTITITPETGMITS